MQVKCTQLPNISKLPHSIPDIKSEFSMHSQSSLSNSKFEDYVIGSSLGEGAYAEVREVLHKRTNTKYAFKIYSKYRIMDSQRKTNLMREIHILEQLNHPGIIKLYHVFETDKSVILVFELVSGESLKSKIRNAAKGIPPEDTLLIFRQICSALDYLHSKSITHRYSTQ